MPVKYWVQSVGALGGITRAQETEREGDLLPCGGAGDLPGQDVPGLGCQVSEGVGQSDGVSRCCSELHVH